MLKIGVTMYETSFPTRNLHLTIPQRGAYPLTDAIFANQALPILLPTVQPRPSIVNRFINHIAGLVLGGGDDITPAIYHQSPIEPELNYPLRDQFEASMIHAAIRHHKPILGICRGCQMLNVSLGGSLYQDIYQQINDRQLINHEFTNHLVTIRSKSHLYRTIGPRLTVNSRHHQAIARLGHHLKWVAKAPDGIIEGIEDSNALIQGVQWHPENLWRTHPKQNRLFKAFFKRVKDNQ